MRLLLYVLLVTMTCWAESPGPVNPENGPTSSQEEITTTEMDEETKAQLHHQWKKDNYKQRQRKLYEGLKADHELCLTGDQRSPVNINFEDAKAVYLPGIEFVNYDSTGKVAERALNHSASLYGFNEWNKAPYIHGGALHGDFVLWEFYQNEYALHSSFEGSVSHSINRAVYDFETHFVHVKRGMTLEQARGVPGAITIVVVGYLKTILGYVEENPEPISESEILWKKHLYPKKVNGTVENWKKPAELIPKQTTSFFSYNGSMPHSPCSPGVTWIVLTKPVHINRAQYYQLNVYRRQKTNVLAQIDGILPTIGNRTVIFNFGVEKDPALQKGYSIFAIILVALVTVVLTTVAWMAFDKYGKKPIERGYVKYFVNNET